MLTSILGVLKTSSTYVPLDPAYPAERVASMVEDSELVLVLSELALSKRLPGTHPKVVLIEELERELEPEAEFNPADSGEPDELVYIIHTSGSTGRPKGIGLPHLCLDNLLQWHVSRGALHPRVLQFASLSFDVSFYEIFRRVGMQVARSVHFPKTPARYFKTEPAHW